MSNDETTRSQQLQRIVAEYLAAHRAGKNPDRQEILRRHADLAEPLREFFAEQDRKATGVPEGREEATLPPRPSSAPKSTDEATLPPRPRSVSELQEDATIPPAARAVAEGADEATLSSNRRKRGGPPPGTKVGYFGDYELLDEIARGGMGVVYKARQVNLNRIVALKMILAGQLASEDDVKRFYTEAEAAATLDHPGIVPIYEVGQYGGQHFFSMGFIQGQSLADKVARGPLLPLEAAEFAKKVCEAIAYAHSKGVIHRDLKPANILLDSDGEPKVTDFGLAKKAEDKEGLTTTGQILGTPGYMPPEQAAGKTDEIGPAADTYSLGAILYCLLTGRPPFQAASVMDTLMQVLEQEPVSPRLLNAEVPRDLETICLKCLRKQPARRYESAAAVADDIGRWLNHEPILARPVSRLEKTWLWCRRKPAIAALLATLVVVMVAAAGLVYERQNATHAAGLVEALVKADVPQIPGVIQELNRYRHWSEPMLRQRLASAKDGSTEQLPLRLALVERDDRQVEPLYESLLRADAGQLPVIRDVLAGYQSRMKDRLWSVLESHESDPQQRRLRAAGALAQYDPGNAKWSEVAPEVAGQLVNVAPVFVGQWREVLRPVSGRLLDPLAKIFSDPEQAGLSRTMAALLLADYAGHDPELLTNLVLDADARAFATLFPALQVHRSIAVEKLRAVLARTVEPDWNDATLNSSWAEPSSEARAAIEGAHGFFDDRCALCQDLPWEEFLRTAEALRASGYRPTRVRPYQGAVPGTLVAAVWTRDGKSWSLQTDLTKDQLPLQNAPAEKDGLVPADIAALPSGDETADRRFVLLWTEPAEAHEKHWLLADVSAQELANAKASFSKHDSGSQSTIYVWTDEEGQRHYAGIWSSVGVPSEMEASYAGYERVEQPQWDVAVAPAAKPADPLDALRQQLAQIANLPLDQREQPPVRLARAQAQFHLGQLETALADLDVLVEQKAVSAEVLQFRAWTFARLGQEEKARAELAKYLELQKDPALRPYVQIVAAAWLGDRDDAAAQLDVFTTAAGTNSDALYNVACAATLASQACRVTDPPRTHVFADRALGALETAIANGYRNAQQLRADVDLASLHPNPRFTGLLEKLETPGRYAALWRADVESESRLLTGLSLDEMREQSRQLVAQGHRPVGIAVDTGASWNATPAPATARVVSSIVWQRPVLSAAEKERLALQQSIAAVALLRLSTVSDTSPASSVWPLFEHQPDPRLRSYLLHRLASYGADPALVLARLKEETEVSRRRALILGIGEFSHANLLSPEQKLAATEAMIHWYADDPDSGIHGAAEWSLRQLGEESQVAKLREKFATGNVEGERQWYVTKTGQQTLAVIRPAEEFLMGSPVTDVERYQGPTGKLESRHLRRIGRTFAIATHEVTVEQFQKYKDGHEFDRKTAREEDAPANYISWYNAAHFCNWLSEQEGIPRDQRCYNPDQKFEAGMSPYPDYLKRTGYRLPTEAEWEYACRSGATTTRHFGETEQLLPHYAWYSKNSHDRWMLPVGSLKPNDAGLFDMHGNVAEWSQDAAFYYLNPRPWEEDKEQLHKMSDTLAYMTRGGSFASNAAFVRAADRAGSLPQMVLNYNGFRVARTIPSSP